MRLKLKHRKAIVFIFRLVLGLLILCLFWSTVLDIVFSIVQGQDPSANLGDNYEIQGSADSIIYYESKEDYKWNKVIPERTLEFAIKDHWLIGRTEKGWFAINKKTHEVNYPVIPKEKIQEITELDISSLDFTDDFRPYAIIQPRTPKIMLGTKVVLVSMFILFVFGSNLYQLIKRHFKNKGVSITL